MLKNIFGFRPSECASSTFRCLLLALLSTGCAEVKYCRMSGNDDDTATGIRYYDSSPFLLLQHDPTGKTWQTQLLYLPDQTKENQAKITCWLAANNSTFTFSNAVLASTSVNVDETVVPVAIMNALAGLAEQATKYIPLMQNNEGIGIPQPPQVVKQVPMDAILFKIVRSTNGDWGLEGAAVPTNGDWSVK